MSGASDLANTLAQSLLAGTDFSVDLPDFSDDDFKVPDIGTTGADAPVPHLSVADLTTAQVDGSGTFDRMMIAYRAHLKQEYEQNRISGAEYTKAYIALTESAMNGAVQFLLGRDAAYWQAVNAQIAAQTAKIALVTARVQLESEKTRLQTLRLEAKGQEITYARNKLGLATESIGFDRAKYELDNLLPQQLVLGQKNIDKSLLEISALTKDNILKDKQTLLAQGEVDLIPAKADMLSKQIIGQDNQNNMVLKQLEQLDTEIALGPDKLALLRKQVASQEAQTIYVGKQTDQVQKEIDLQPYKISMIKEQVEQARAQTLDTRSDGTLVSGSLGKQKDLYGQQITSYRRDAEMKAAKVFVDAWVTMKTIDEGLAPPVGFSNANLDTILASIKTNNNI